MFLDSCLFVMKYLIIKVECVEGPGETEFRVWRIIMQVWAFYMQECKGTLSPLFLGSTVGPGHIHYVLGHLVPWPFLR